jgi:hypothetical protein
MKWQSHQQTNSAKNPSKLCEDVSMTKEKGKPRGRAFQSGSAHPRYNPDLHGTSLAWLAAIPKETKEFSDSEFSPSSNEPKNYKGSSSVSAAGANDLAHLVSVEATEDVPFDVFCRPLPFEQK